MSQENEKKESILNGITGEILEELDDNFFENNDLIVDIQKLLTPIPGDDPAGEDLRYEGTYDRIKNARKEDDSSLPQGVWKHELKKADWELVATLCIEALETRTKDLQISMWLLEALSHVHGARGVNIGLKIIMELSKKFWDTLFPEIVGDDEESIDARVSPLVWMNEKLSYKLYFLPITMPDNDDLLTYNYSNWKKMDVDDLKAKFLRSVMFTSKSFYEDLHLQLNSSLKTIYDFKLFVNEKFGDRAPSLNNYIEVMENIFSLIKGFLKDKEEESAFQAEEPDTTTQKGKGLIGSSEGIRSIALSIRSRAEAYRMLSEAADYLLIHEPHSPTPYLVKRAVSWGGMTLTELLSELVNDEHDLNKIFNLLGLPQKQNSA